MLNFDGPVEAKNALQEFLIERKESVPAPLRDHLRELITDPSSPVVVSVRAAEAVFVRSEIENDVGEQLRDWAAASAVMCETFGFETFGVGKRGSRMAKRLRGQALPVAQIPELNTEIAKIVAPAPPMEDDEPVAAKDDSGD